MALLSTKQKILEFIRTYRSLPELWDNKSRDYANRRKKQEAYDVLIDKLNLIEPNSNRLTVVKKINNLRTSFRKELKKVREFKTNGESYEPTLWYYNEMMFLLGNEMEDGQAQHELLFLVDQDNPESGGSLALASYRTLDESNDNSDNLGDESEQNQDEGNDNHKQDLNVKSENEPRSPLSNKRKTPSTNYSFSRNKKPFYEPQIGLNIDANDFESTAKNLLNFKDTPNAKEDSYDCFGKYIASLLRSIGPPQALRLQESITSQVITAMCQRQSLQKN